MGIDVAESIFVVITVLVAFVGVITSLILMWLIKDMGSTHDFNTLIYYMTAFDLVYFALGWCQALPNDKQTQPVADWVNIFQLAGGTASYIISSYISFLIVHLLLTYKVWDLRKWKNALICLVIAPNAVWMTLSFIGLLTGERNLFLLGVSLSVYIRLIPIIFNVICYIISKIKVASTTATKGSIKSPQETAITVLVERLKWYPLLQVITRIIPTWLAIEFQDNSMDKTYRDPYYYILNVISSIFLLWNPVGSLGVYLLMQPNARKHLFNYLKTKFGINCFSKDNVNTKPLDSKRIPEIENDDRSIYKPKESLNSERNTDRSDDNDYNYNKFDSAPEPKEKQKSKSTSSNTSFPRDLYRDDDDLNSQWNEMDDGELVDIICENDFISHNVNSPITEMRTSTSSTPRLSSTDSERRRDFL